LGKSHENIQQSYSFKRLMADVLGETDFWRNNLLEDKKQKKFKRQRHPPHTKPTETKKKSQTKKNNHKIKINYNEHPVIYRKYLIQ